MTLRHIVAFTLSTTGPTDRVANALQLKAELDTLPAQIPALLDLQVSVNVLDIAGNADVVLIADVADADALQEYMTHPAHQAVIDRTSHLLAGRTAIDIH